VTSPTPGTDDEVALLTSLLAAEHAAAYGYGVLGARLDPAGRPAAQAALTAARASRDTLAGLLRDRGVDPPGPLPVYDVAVAGRPEALALAVELEQGLAVRWHDLVGGTDDRRLRRLGVDGLSAAAVRASSWRLLAGQRPATVALPGVL